MLVRIGILSSPIGCCWLLLQSGQRGGQEQTQEEYIANADDTWWSSGLHVAMGQSGHEADGGDWAGVLVMIWISEEK
jgi:hypothetical protein